MAKEFQIKEIANVDFTPEKLEKMDSRQRVQILEKATNELFKFKQEFPHEWNIELQDAYDIIKMQIAEKSKVRPTE